MARSTWTEGEVEILLAEHTAGRPRRQIAELLGRPKSTIDYRLATLGVRDAPRDSDLAERFWAQVDRGANDACWAWRGYCDADGYGSISVWPSRTGAHRLAYELTHGNVPKGMAVRHRCDNPPCCNPAHLELGTILDNNRDKTARGRDARGERHGMAKYSAEQVLEVKRLLGAGVARAEIVERTGVNRHTVQTIASGRQWKEVVRR